MKQKVLYATILLFCFSSFELFSQSADKDEKKLIKDAELFFEDGDFANALPLYRELTKAHPTDPMFNFCLGVSYLSLPPNETEEITKDKAIPHLELARGLEMNDVNYYLGYAYHLNYEWDKAIEYYTIYMDSLAMNEPYYLTPLLIKKEEFARIERQVEMCQSGKILLRDSADITFTNMGIGINSRYPDYAPAISADNEVLIFTSRRPADDGSGKVDQDFFYYEDIFITYKIGGKWIDAIRIGENVNTKKHNASIGLSADAQTLFVYKNGDIYISELEGLEWTKPKKLGKAINTSYWETHITMTSAQNTIYFVSDRKGGYGGRDIYRAYLQADGTWGNVENLGPTINTPDDEEAPFIHPDERTLYFSSNGHNSMGGFDIFLAHLKDGVWDRPINMGYPINTTGDDIYFTISSNGKSGYMSTIRKGGVGEKDVFIANMPDTGDVPLTVIRGLIKDEEGQPLRADFSVIDRKTNKLVGKYKSNSATGKYLLVFPPGSDYDVVIAAADHVPHTEQISIPEQNRFYDLFQEIQLSSATRTEADGTDSVIGQQVVVRNAFFDIDSVIAVADKGLKSIDQKELAYSFFLGDLEFNTPEERAAIVSSVGSIEGVGNMVQDYKPLEQVHITEGVASENLEMHVVGYDTIYTTSSATATIASEDSLLTAGIKLQDAYFASREEVESAEYHPEEAFVTKGIKEGLEEVFSEEDSTALALVDTEKERIAALKDEEMAAKAAAEAAAAMDKAAEEAVVNAAAEAEAAIEKAAEVAAAKAEAEAISLMEKAQAEAEVAAATKAAEDAAAKAKAEAEVTAATKAAEDAAAKAQAEAEVAAATKAAEDAAVKAKAEAEVTAATKAAEDAAAKATAEAETAAATKAAEDAAAKAQAEAEATAATKAAEDAAAKAQAEAEVAAATKAAEDAAAKARMEAETAAATKAAEEAAAKARAEEEARKTVTMEELDKELLAASSETEESKSETTESKEEAEVISTSTSLIDKSFVLANVYFDFNSSNLNASSRKAVDVLWTTLDKASNMKVEISGHTDNKGEAAYNQLLSLARANSVVKHLIQKGIPSSRLVAKGYGASSPMEPNSFPDGTDNPDGRQSNRRTELKVLDISTVVASETTATTSGSIGKVDGVEITVGSIGTGVTDRVPVGVASSFISSIERLYHFTTVMAKAGEEGTVTHIWYYEGQKMAEVSLKYRGPRWRTYSSKRIVPSWKGKWKVDVVSNTGAILKSTEFTVE